MRGKVKGGASGREENGDQTRVVLLRDDHRDCIPNEEDTIAAELEMLRGAGALRSITGPVASGLRARAAAGSSGSKHQGCSGSGGSHAAPGHTQQTSCKVAARGQRYP